MGFNLKVTGTISMLLVAACSASAQLQLDKFFGSGMVLQRDAPLRFKGRGVPGKTVTLRFGNATANARVDAAGGWQLSLPAMPANNRGQVLTVQMDTSRLQLSDILLGDIWVCAGQSNMEFRLRDDKYAAEALQQASIPLLRLKNEEKQTPSYNESYGAKDTAALRPGHYYKGQWKVSSAGTARNFSAVGFYFGKQIVEQVKVPVGLIHVAIGGSPAEAWVRPAAAAGNAQLLPIFTGDWWNNKALEPWCIKRGHENLDSLVQAGALIPRDSLGYNHAFKPGFLYEAAIAPLLGFPVKGIIWYQGESNALSAERAIQHEALFPLLIADWRQQWQQPDMPFYFCQLSSISTEKGYHSENWPYFRNSQRRMADSIPNAGMAVTSDVGNLTNVHPTDKKTVGNRLARVALKQTYHKNILASGPAPLKAVWKDNVITVSFAATGKKLGTADGAPLRGFVTTDGTPLEATIAGQQVLVRTAGKIAVLRYGWTPYMTANLCNSDSLPASTFEIGVE